MELLRKDFDALYGQGQRHTTAGAYRSELWTSKSRDSCGELCRRPSLALPVSHLAEKVCGDQHSVIGTTISEVALLSMAAALPRYSSRYTNVTPLKLLCIAFMFCSRSAAEYAA